MRFLLRIPVHDASPPVNPEGAFKCIPFGSHKRIIAVNLIAVLQKRELRPVQAVQLFRLFGVPEHVMIAAGQDLSSRQAADIVQILFAFGELPPPAVVTGQHQRVLCRNQLFTVLPELFLMILPYPVPQLGRRFQHRLEMQMQIADCVQCHGVRSPLFDRCRSCRPTCQAASHVRSPCPGRRPYTCRR